MMRCSQCSNTVADTDRFCAGCGEALPSGGDVANPTEPAQPVAADDLRRQARPWVVVLAVLISLTCFGLFIGVPILVTELRRIPIGTRPRNMGWLIAGSAYLLLAVVYMVNMPRLIRELPEKQMANSSSSTAASSTDTAGKSALIHGQLGVNPQDGAEMVWIPEGEFQMGSTEEQITAWLRDNPTDKAKGFEREKPQHTVDLSGYWMYKYNVTVAQYRKFCTATGRVMPVPPKWGWVDSHPVVNVTWNDAFAYAQWAKAALPSEAQWEKAARGTDGRRFPWGNT